MSRFVANLDILTETWADGVERIDILLDALSNEIITANGTYANTANTLSPRHAQLFGSFTGNTLIVTNSLRGGNVSSSANLNITSNTIVSNVTFQSAANSLYSNNQLYTANILFSGPQIDASSNTFITGSLQVTNNSQIFKSNTTITAISIAGNTTSTVTTVGGNTLTVSANVNVTGTSHTYTGNSNFDSGSLFVDSVNDRVGIGTTTPNARLQVNGAANVTGNVVVSGTLTSIGNASFNANVNISGTTNTSSLNVNDVLTIENNFVFDTYANSNLGATGSPKLIFSYPSATYSGGKLLVSIKNGTSSQVQELVVTHDGTDPYITVYGVVASPPGANNSAPLGTISTAMNGANVEIYFNQVNTGCSSKVLAQLVK